MEIYEGTLLYYIVFYFGVTNLVYIFEIFSIFFKVVGGLFTRLVRSEFDPQITR